MRQTIGRQYSARPLFENMPEMPDDTLWDLLKLLYGLIDAYECHYAVELERLRAHRYNERMAEQDQLPLPLSEPADTPF